MFRSVKNTVYYYFGANNDVEEDKPVTCDKSTQTDDFETKSVETQSVELFVPSTVNETPSTTTNTTNIEVSSLLQRIIDDVDKTGSLPEKSSSDSAFTDDSDEDESCLPIDLKKYKQSRPCPLSEKKKEQLNNADNKISPTYSETLQYANKKRNKQYSSKKKIELFDVKGASSVTNIKINPDMLKLLEAKKDDEEEEYFNNQRKHMKIKHDKIKNSTKTQEENIPNLKIKLPIVNTKISPRKIPPNAPRAQDSIKSLKNNTITYKNQENKRYSLRQRKNTQSYKY